MQDLLMKSAKIAVSFAFCQGLCTLYWYFFNHFSETEALSTALLGHFSDFFPEKLIFSEFCFFTSAKCFQQTTTAGVFV